jgi:flagellar hook-associated protein 3 FlgL
VAQQTAASTVAEMTSVLNTQVNGIFILRRQNTDKQPIADYETGGGKAAFDAAFQAYFGFAKDDPPGLGGHPAQIEDFLNVDVSRSISAPAGPRTYPPRPTRSSFAYFGCHRRDVRQRQ